MKITPFQTKLNSKNIYQKQKNKKIPFGNFSHITPLPENTPIKPFLNSIRQIFNNKKLNKLFGKNLLNINTYKKLTSTDKKILSELSIKPTVEAAEDAIIFSQPIKNFLEKKYGKDNYIFVSIGRSPVIIGRAMEFMGTETKYLPISSLFKVKKEEINSYINHKPYLKYIDKIGINPENLNNGKRKAVFYDFTVTGHTLNAMKNFLKLYAGIPEHFMEFRSLNHDIIELSQEPFSKKADFIGKYFYDSKSAQYSHIPKLNYWQMDEIDSKMDRNKISLKTNFFNFNLLLKLEQIGLLANKNK